MERCEPHNEFSEGVSKAAFDGSGLFGEKFSVTSPELTTDGTFDKCWLRTNKAVRLIKAGSVGASNAGREPYSEVLASQIFQALLGGNAVEYTLDKYYGRVVSSCNLFTSQDCAYLPYSIFIKYADELTDILKKYAEYGCEDMFRGMIIGDCVSLNVDRHYNNFGWLCNTETMRRVSMAPVFDFNMSMAVYADDVVGFPDFEEYLSTIGPRIGEDFISPAKALLTPEYRTKLINLKDLWLEVECDEKFTEDRLKKINVVKNVQIDRILGRSAQFAFYAS